MERFKIRSRPRRHFSKIRVPQALLRPNRPQRTVITTRRIHLGEIAKNPCQTFRKITFKSRQICHRIAEIRTGNVRLRVIETSRYRPRHIDIIKCHETRQRAPKYRPSSLANHALRLRIRSERASVELKPQVDFKSIDRESTRITKTKARDLSQAFIKNCRNNHAVARLAASLVRHARHKTRCRF